MYRYPVLSPDNLLLGCIRFDSLGLFSPQVPGLSKRDALNILNRLNLRVSESKFSKQLLLLTSSQLARKSFTSKHNHVSSLKRV